MKRAIILFTRVPIPGQAKTRLFDFVSQDQACEIQRKLLHNIDKVLMEREEDIFVFYTPANHEKELRELMQSQANYKPQCAGDLGQKMSSAIEEVLKSGYESVLLMGSDLVALDKARIDRAFSALRSHDVVINPSVDGGYTIIGMNEGHSEIFQLPSFGNDSVYDRTIARVNESKLSVSELDAMLDIDTKEDLVKMHLGTDSIKLIGADGYIINYSYRHGNEKRILRINTGSQMQLENQTIYEYNSLKILEKTGVTPKAYYYDEGEGFIPHVMLEIECPEGRALDYRRDMDIAAYLLSSVHELAIPENHGLPLAEKPLKGIYDECSEMAKRYLGWTKRDEGAANKISYFLKRAIEMGLEEGPFSASIINTELNSENFIINQEKEHSRILGWQNAMIGEKEQDLACLLAPTTTYLKTGVILSDEEMEDFLEEYERYAPVNRERFKKYLCITCLRGIALSAMTLIEYESQDRILKDAFTYQKAREYLSPEFLGIIETYFK
jgi:rSAM/selenodomain-associated transferase 1